jgi:tRNA-splicing ligase RtcB
MKKVISTERIPIKLWLDDMEDGAMQQAKNLANLPFAFHHIAIMPDSHQGFGMPIGGVLATDAVVIPNAVGCDIGCGLIAVRTSLTEIDKETLKKIMSGIREEIPVGFNHHKEKQDVGLMPAINFHGPSVINSEFEKALYSLGTLGGGNHFLSFEKGSDGFIWIMLHSGSRNLGKQVADYYNKKAVELNEMWYSSVPKQHQLAFLPLGTDEAESYVNEMKYCVDYALANRKLMMNRIVEIVANEVQNNVGFVTNALESMINIAHNYAKLENHFGKNVIVHRKGATLATDKTIGIIPGSQGTKSYIVKGKGNPDSFMSCSHGAGRAMSRTNAIKNLSLEAEQKLLDDQGIIHSVRSQKDLDEAAGSYKDISKVMANQTDLVEVLVELTPLAVIKG